MREGEERRVGVLARLVLLTPREREIMEMVVAGETNKVIARRLGVSSKTVEAHRAHLMAKMQADNTAELVRLAVVCRILGGNPKSNAGIP
jgi:two-component system response regulator FixJ